MISFAYAEKEGLVSFFLGSKIYSFPVFTSAFCREFKEELENFEMSDMPKGRPNTMNTSGVS